jgi:glycosyltransferase involved in cell wall biosynthesis
MGRRPMKEVSIIIPAYNEEESIGETLDQVKGAMDQSGFAHEIIVVDDGSTDGTARIARERGVKLLQHPSNLGYGASLKAGIRRARYAVIAITDADGSYPSWKIPALLESIDEYDMVVGARVGERVSIPLMRRPAKWLLTRLANYLVGKEIPDLNSGLRVFKKEIALAFFRILPSGFSFTATITLALLANDYLVKFVPIDYYPRGGRSKIRPVQDTLNFISLIVRTVMYYSPLKVFMPLSLIFLLAGVIRGAYGIVTIRNISDSDLLLFVTGMLIGTVGLLADLIDKTRP